MWCCLRDPMFSRVSRTPTCDRQTDGHGHRRKQGCSLYRASVVSRGKNYKNRTILARVIAENVRDQGSFLRHRVGSVVCALTLIAVDRPQPAKHVIK